MRSVPLVSLITLNFNQAELTCALLESIQRLSYPAIEVIVVDNNSEEDPTELIRKRNFKDIKVIVTDKNLGFAGGNNVGIRQAKGDYVLLLNNDTEVTPDLIERLLEPFEHDTTLGVTCPKIRYFQEPTVIQYAGYTPLNQYTGQAWSIGSHQEDIGQFNTSGITPFAHGAAMMVKREVLERAGLLPELYFLYYEELDWCCRIIQAGYKIYYQSSALVFHKESMTVGKGNPMKVYYQTRNRIVFMRRNVSSLSLLIFSIYFTALALPKAVLIYCLRGQFLFLKAFLQGVRWNLHHTVERPTVSTQQTTLIDNDLVTLKASV
ncbi:glycosyltransferase family 2 protein [Spirosoma pollinicola]|uniref:dTDP-Rha--alpha-D-GlcNAc-pyrophosphate polyprenol alpha-3-L-rhamnosyltransferase n=1 Tax=Spirosoma pollinicola TaxID=2057025 RepID=A0A2K8Z778_9BACT|nr:glycosyltransferase family 2 protein [Spirosoma pollinicola]AUD05746.1 dTDP-Rha--alpha-D-GlcNAc-pyrophosphate polyprenol alpha-3-L-rhamnosyltransferase [Spirosoma pollinicola]